MMKRLMTLAQVCIFSGFALPVLALPLVGSKPFVHKNMSYGVRTITASSEGAIIEVTFQDTDDTGKKSTIYRQYRVLNSCRNPVTLSTYGFLGEHSVNDFGVVTFANPQPDGTTISANSGIGQVVGAAFRASCRR